MKEDGGQEMMVLLLAYGQPVILGEMTPRESDTYWVLMHCVSVTDPVVGACHPPMQVTHI